MTTCDTCKHWNLPEKTSLVGPMPKTGYCSCPKLDEDAEDSAVSNDGIFTGPKFGCVHWEGK